MKKTLISLVLVFALLSTCVFSAVFAKYSVTSGVQTITATVSAFGVTAVTISEVATNLTPGANGVLAQTEITGTPATGITAVLKYTNVTLTKSNNWTDDGKALDTSETPTNTEYFPIEFTINGTPYKIGDTGIDNFDDLAGKVKEEIEKLSITVVGETEGNPQVEEIISWKWIPGTHDNAVADQGTTEEPRELSSFSLTLTATVEQN